MNKDTGKFTVKQWTTGEREEYESTKDSSKQNETQHPDNPSANPDRNHAAGTPGARTVAPYEPGKGNKQRKIFLHWTEDHIQHHIVHITRYFRRWNSSKIHSLRNR